MANEAARAGQDDHFCPAMQAPPPPAEKGCCSKVTLVPPKPHVGGKIVTAGSPNVKVNGKPAARTGDAAACTGVGTVDTLVTGAAKVKINGQLGVRVGSIGAHIPQAFVQTGSANVKYGGGAGGASFGDATSASEEACLKAAETRGMSSKKDQKKPEAESTEGLTPEQIEQKKKDAAEKRKKESTGQTKEMNCGIESVRQLCIQRCQATHDDKACKLGSMNEDEVYKHYLETYKQKHNEVAMGTDEKTLAENKRRVAENDKTWESQRSSWGWNGWMDRKTNNEKGSAPRSFKETHWRDVGAIEGTKKTIFTYGSESTLHSSGSVQIWGVPLLIDDVNKDANEGKVGSYTATRELMLKECGYEAPGQGENSPSGIAGDLAKGNNVLAVVDIGKLNGNGPGGPHTITVTRMEYGPDGQLVKVVVNDTGDNGGCGRELTPPSRLAESLIDGPNTNTVPRPKP